MAVLPLDDDNNDNDNDNNNHNNNNNNHNNHHRNSTVTPARRGPPTVALPPLPISKSRRRLGPRSAGESSPAGIMSDGPLSSSRTPSVSPLATAASKMAGPMTIETTTLPGSTAMSTSASTPDEHVPLSAPPRPNPVVKDVRPMVSLPAFPHPPGADGRSSSLPTPTSPRVGPSALTKSTAAAPLVRRGSADANGAARPSTGPPRLKRRRGLMGSNVSLGPSSGTPGLRNGTAENRSVSSRGAARRSDARSSLHSRPPSRSSSAQGSDSTAATTLEDSSDNGPRGRDAGTTAAPVDDGWVDEGGRRDSRSKPSKGNVVVSVRVRPDASGDNGQAEGEWIVDGRRSLVAYRGREGGNYFYDHVFAPHDQNVKVYDACAKRLVRRVMEGYHGTIFAYGMTGTGKTFSMQGTATSPGVIPLAIADIFSYIRETPHREFLLRVSYLEIYNERIHDLLSASPAPGTTQAILAPQEEIKLREDSKRGVYASPLKEEIVQSPTQLLRVIARGDLSRRTSCTQYNARSSRSHAVVQIVVESRERIAVRSTSRDAKRSAMVPGGVRVSTLSLIDLAGSERAAESKERRQEGAHINKSLLTLGTVIARLSGDVEKAGRLADRDGKHLPYRDSKLTRLLQPALSGNSLISILCTIQIGSAGSVAAHNGHTGETLNTLKFAARAKNNIVSRAQRAEEAYGSGSGDAASRVLLERYRVEIQALRGQLDDQARAKRETEETTREKEAVHRHEEQMLEMQLARTALKERIEHLNRLILCSKSTGVNASTSLLSLGTYPSVANHGHLSTSSTRSASSRSVAAVGGPGTLGRTVSAGSTSTGGPDSIQAPSQNMLTEPGPEEDDLTGEYGDGTASLSIQVGALQADLADKNRYISTLEKRLLQARRSSHSRTSLGFSPTRNLTGYFGEDNDVAAVLLEKDNEIAELRARLDDKDRMMAALRSAARKRDVADMGSDRRWVDAPIRPVLSSREVSPDGDNVPHGTRSASKTGDEMSRILDEMIQDRVENGQLIKGSRGSLHPAIYEQKREALGQVKA